MEPLSGMPDAIKESSLNPEGKKKKAVYLSRERNNKRVKKYTASLTDREQVSSLSKGCSEQSFCGLIDLLFLLSFLH